MISSRFQKRINLSDYTTFKIGGPAKYFFISENKDDLIKALEWAVYNGEKFFILGGGSNVLFKDDGFDGLVIKVAGINEIKIEKGLEGKKILSVDAGYRLTKLVEFSRSRALTGMEWAAGIPGTVGGAIRGNAGAFGKDMSHNIKDVEILEIRRKKIALKNLTKEQCEFAYRTSLLKESRRVKYIVLSARLELGEGKKEEIEEEIKSHLKFRMEKQSVGYPNAGSVFKNAEYSKILHDEEKTNIPEQFKKTGIVPAGWLIEACGLKGRVHGNAMISNLHANFIVNLGKATAQDIFGLINLVEQEVERKFEVKLEREIVIA